MTNFNLIFLFLLIFFIQQSITEYPPIIPLTNALTTIYCHNNNNNNNEAGIMTIRCGLNEKIRMLDAYDVVVKNKSRLPLQCLKQKHFSLIHDDQLSHTDCKMPTSFISACSGRENCTVHMQQIRLISAKDNCHDELVDYTIAFFECISDVFIHDVCSTQAITSAWGTLKTPNFPNPYTSNDDCWCKLSTQLQYQLLLSVIVFQLIPYDEQCASAGLYLQGSDAQQSTQCTYLQQGYKYLSDMNSLYINFYSRTSTVRGGFWIIYEANHPNAEVHLHCGTREKIGAPSSTTLFPSIYNHGWSRLVYHNSLNPTSTIDDEMIPTRPFTTTSRSFFHRNFKITTPTAAAGAFTYPYGRLTTFELDYGPKGWFLKYLFGTSNMTATKFLQTTTSQLPVVKWNSTWRYFRRPPRPRIFTTKTTYTTTISTIILPKTTLTLPTTVTSTILTTKQNTTSISSSSSTTTSTSTVQNTSAQQRISSTDKPWLYSITNTKNSSTTTTTTTKPDIISTTYFQKLSSTLKTTVPLPTPWYPPAGPFDWWQWKWYTTKLTKVSSKILNTTQTSTTTTITTVTTNPTTSSTIIIKNTTNILTSSRENTTTVDWFQWPHYEFTSTVKERSDYDEEYKEWLDYFATTQIQPEVTTNSLLFFPPERPRKKFQQMNYLPTRFNPQFMYHLPTKPTSIHSRYSTSQSINKILERKSSGNQFNDIIENNSPKIIERENKKSSEENLWLNKTDLTIVGVSILFVFLLITINLIVFAIRRSRHRHQLQEQNLFNGSTINSRRTVSNDHHFQNTRHSIPINSFNTTNNNNNDILPAVGEIVIWDNKDQGGYTIDNQGEWSKIDGRQWFGNNLLKNCSKTSFSKSFRSRFQFIRQSNKKPIHCHQQNPKTPPQSYKYPLLMDTVSLSPVPEVDDYRLSDLSSEVAAIKKSNSTSVHKEQEHSDDYYKRIETYGSVSNYTTVHGNTQGEYSLGDQQTDRSLGNEIDGGETVIISVPTMLRQEDDHGATSDGGDSIYNQNYSIQSFEKNLNTRLNYRNKSSMNNTIIIGHCQTNFQTLDPKLFLKKTDKSLLADHEQLYNYSQSYELTAYDSGFFDDQTMNQSDLSEKFLNDHDIELNNLTKTDSKKFNR